MIRKRHRGSRPGSASTRPLSAIIGRQPITFDCREAHLERVMNARNAPTSRSVGEFSSDLDGHTPLEHQRMGKRRFSRFVSRLPVRLHGLRTH